MNSWKDDIGLKNTLEDFVKAGLKRIEILDFLKRDFENYDWSIRTLDRRLRHFDIFYVDLNTNLKDVSDAISEELRGPGQLLGYRAMQQKLRQIHGLKVSRGVVHATMQKLDPDGLKERLPCVKKKARGHFTSPGTNWVHSLDGHDKLMGYQNSTYPIAVYGCLDTCSRKLLWVNVSTSNKDPRLIGRFYLEHLFVTRKMSRYLRLDRGTETGTMATMHAYLIQNHLDEADAVDSVLYGPSTSNQIERWWKELHERLEKFFKLQLNWLKDRGHYDPSNQLHRSILAYLMVPMMQKHIDEFVVIWNNHRIREQKEKTLPSGIPNHIYEFPERYGLEECGIPVSLEDLEKVAAYSGVLHAERDSLPASVRAACQQVLPEPHKVDPANCCAAYCNMKRHVAGIIHKS